MATQTPPTATGPGAGRRSRAGRGASQPNRAQAETTAPGSADTTTAAGETGPDLRLVSSPGPPSPESATEAVTEAADPRWVLATRTAEQLQGTVLAPEQRERLLSLGRMLGLSPFDSNLVIAIVQDQARRGVTPAACAEAGAEQLAMVPRPRRRPLRHALTASRLRTVAWLVMGLLGLELAILAWLF